MRLVLLECYLKASAFHPSSQKKNQCVLIGNFEDALLSLCYAQSFCYFLYSCSEFMNGIKNMFVIIELVL